MPPSPPLANRLSSRPSAPPPAADLHPPPTIAEGVLSCDAPPGDEKPPDQPAKKKRKSNKRNSPSYKRCQERYRQSGWARAYNKGAFRAADMALSIIRESIEGRRDPELSALLLMNFRNAIEDMNSAGDFAPPFLDRAMAKACEAVGVAPPTVAVPEGETQS